MAPQAPHAIITWTRRHKCWSHNTVREVTVGWAFPIETFRRNTERDNRSSRKESLRLLLQNIFSTGIAITRSVSHYPNRQATDGTVDLPSLSYNVITWPTRGTKNLELILSKLIMLAMFIKKREYVVKFMEIETKNSIFSLFKHNLMNSNKTVWWIEPFLSRTINKWSSKKERHY